MSPDATWPWLALVGLGAYHGINPAMGWLFAVALGLHRHRRAVVLWALVPLALGHAGAILVTLVVVGGVGLVVEAGVLRRLAGAVLIGWGVLHAVRTPRHRVRVGLRAGFAGLALWSFFMGLAHGAGLMLVPVFTEWPGAAATAPGILGPDRVSLALAAVGAHTLAMIVVTGVTALLVHDWLGVGILHRGWFNLDRVWAAALVAAGLLLVLG